ncbi:MAG TPA: threonine-phosphate decarboxylase [Nitrososphaera sp.]
MRQDISHKAMSACSHGGIYSADHRLVRIDCSSSVNPLGPPAGAISAIQKNARALVPRYPDPQCSDLKKSLARYVDVEPDCISVGNGAVEIVYWFAQAFAGKQVVIPAPTFCEYELASRKAGARVTFVPLLDFELASDLIIEKAAGADALFLCNPNNPTGILSTPQVKRIIEEVGSRTKILLDECFVELVDDPGRNSMIRLAGEHDNLVILRSLTKSFGLAGLRVGYSICNPALSKRLAASTIPWNVNGLAQAAGVAALADKNYLERARSLIKKERRFLHDRIRRTKMFRPCKSDANFFMIRLSDRNSTEFRDLLLKRTGILVRDCSTFTGMGSQHIRVAVKTHRENVLLVKALESFDRDD